MVDLWVASMTTARTPCDQRLAASGVRMLERRWVRHVPSASAYLVWIWVSMRGSDLTSAATRRAALRHALLSYLFGTVIVATAINLIVGLGK